MAISFFNEDIEKPSIKINQVKSWINTVIKSHEKTTGNINIIFCSDEYLLKMNKEYLDHDYYTDVITFDYSEDAISGDIFISLDRVNENAVKLNTRDTELYRVMIHGILHLIGFDDHNEADIQEMRNQEDISIKLFKEC